MRGFFRKLGFVHARLWHEGGGYRTSLLLGPAPLLGAAIAGLAWVGMHEYQAVIYQPARWAVAPVSDTHRATADEPEVFKPFRALPTPAPDGSLPGLEPGWRVAVHTIDVAPTMDVDVKPASDTGSMLIKEPGADMSWVQHFGPSQTLYVAGAISFLAVRQAGTYALAAQFERPRGDPVNCLVRLGIGPHRIDSNLELNIRDPIKKDYRPSWLSLQPGLYPVAWVFGCWHDQQVMGPGRFTILISHPGEQTLTPAQPDDFVFR